VPAFRYDGKAIQDLYGTGPAYPEFFTWLRGAVDSLKAIPSPITITITSQYASADLDSVYVSFDVEAVDTLPYDATPDLYLAVSERAHTYPPTVGQHKRAFRHMYPDGDGEMISIQKGQTLHFDWVYPIIDPPYHVDKLMTTIWVQNDKDTSIPGPQRNKVQQALQASVVDVASVVRGDGTDVKIGLSQNAPNPFTSETTIAYMVQGGGKAHLAIYTPAGRLVTSLVDGYVEPGTHAATWNGQDRFGKDVGSGVYYYRLETEKGSRGGRMVFLK